MIKWLNYDGCILQLSQPNMHSIPSWGVLVSLVACLACLPVTSRSEDEPSFLMTWKKELLDNAGIKWRRFFMSFFFISFYLIISQILIMCFIIFFRGVQRFLVCVYVWARLNKMTWIRLLLRSVQHRSCSQMFLSTYVSNLLSSI